MALSIVAVAQIHPDKVDHVKKEMLKLVTPTRSEAGCLQYDLHQGAQDPAMFVFVERWESRELWQAHMASPHIAAFNQATPGAFADFKLCELVQVEPEA